VRIEWSDGSYDEVGPITQFQNSFEYVQKNGKIKKLKSSNGVKNAILKMNNIAPIPYDTSWI